MHRCRNLLFLSGCAYFAAVWISASCMAQTASSTAQTQSSAPLQQAIGAIDIAATREQIHVAGAVTLSGDSTLLGNGSTVTAGKVTLPIRLTRGGLLDLCATTELHLSQQNSAADPDSPLMMALDHGALEAHYKIGKNSDVVLTPDLRILLSGPGKADVRIRVNAQGDTCVDNRGKDAPYVTVSEQMGPGVYRVQANQRVLFEHGSVRDVVDHEAEPCGCPAATPPVSVASAGSSAAAAKRAAKPGQPVGTILTPLGGPSSTPADTAFPLAESEGLALPPVSPTATKNMPGVVQSQITTTLSYVAPQTAVPTGAPDDLPTAQSAATVATAPAAGFGPSVNTGSVVAEPVVPAPAPNPRHRRGFFRSIGHFFAKVFG